MTTESEVKPEELSSQLSELYPVPEKQDTVELIEQFKEKWRVESEALRDILAQKSATSSFYNVLNAAEAFYEISSILQNTEIVDKKDDLLENALNSTKTKLKQHQKFGNHYVPGLLKSLDIIKNKKDGEDVIHLIERQIELYK